MVFCATVYHPAAEMRILCHCRNPTKQGVLRQLVFNLVVIRYLRQSLCDSLEFARMLIKDVHDIKDVEMICMKYGKSSFNDTNGVYLHVVEL